VRGRPWLVIAASSAVLAISSGFGRFSYGLLLPAMERTSLGSFGRAGWLGTVNLAAYLVGVAVINALGGRVPAIALVRGGLLGTAAGLGLLAVAPSYTLLVAAMALVGLASAGVWIPMTGIIAACVAPARRGVALGFTVAGSGLGVVAADLIATLVGGRFGPGSWRVVFGVEAALGVVVLAAVVVAIPSRPSEVVATPTLARAFRHLADRRAVLVTYGAFGLGYVIYTTYLVASLERAGGLAPRVAGGAFALLGATSVVGGVALGHLSDRFGRRGTLFASQVCLVGCSLALPTSSLWVALASAGAFGVLMSGVGATVVAHLADSMEPRQVPAVFGILTVAFGTAQCVGPLLGGFLIDRTGGFRAAFVTAAAAFAIAALGAVRLRPRAVSDRRTEAAFDGAVDVQREI
jgi:predicted MFS family arabinose efflux permease